MASGGGAMCAIFHGLASGGGIYRRALPHLSRCAHMRQYSTGIVGRPAAIRPKPGVDWWVVSWPQTRGRARAAGIANAVPACGGVVPPQVASVHRTVPYRGSPPARWSDRAMRIPGVIHRSEISRLGIEPRQVRRWLASEQLRSVGTWYITAEAPDDLVSLLAVGVRPTCLDAAALYGLFIPLHPGVHVYRPRTSPTSQDRPRTRMAPLRRRADPHTGELVSVRYRDERLQELVFHGPQCRMWPSNDPVPDLSQVLLHSGRCLPVKKAAALFESALNKRLITEGELSGVIGALPSKVATPLSRVRGDAESGTETTVRWWLESLRVPVRPQVVIPGVGRVDLLIGNSWIIECDSRQFHDDPEQYHRDRARDLRLRAVGYTVTRLTWEQVFLQWEETEQMLLAVIRRRDHRRRPAA